jgi:Skp family chaperone for outer membrane proteins
MTNVAVVDMTRLYDFSNAALAYEQNAAVIANDAEQRLKTISASLYLEGEEIQEFVNLVGKFTPTPQEEERLKVLQGVSAKRAEEMQTLQGKKSTDLTPEDKKRLQRLLDMSRNYTTQVIPNMQAQLRNLASLKAQTFRYQQMTELRNTVGKYAKEKGIQHVFDSTTLIYTPNDITQAVLERINKKK